MSSGKQIKNKRIKASKMRPEPWIEAVRDGENQRYEEDKGKVVRRKFRRKADKESSFKMEERPEPWIEAVRAFLFLPGRKPEI